MSAPFRPAKGREGRPLPVALPGGGGVFVPPEATPELAAALLLLGDYLKGVTPPAACRTPRLSPAVAMVLQSSQETAVAYRRREAQRSTSAAPTVPLVPFLPPAQPAGSSQRMVTTAVAAEAVGTSAEWVRRLAADGRIRAQRAPRNTWLVDLDDLRSYRFGRTRGTGRDAGDADPGRTHSRGAA